MLRSPRRMRRRLECRIGYICRRRTWTAVRIVDYFMASNSVSSFFSKSATVFSLASIFARSS